MNQSSLAKGAVGELVSFSATSSHRLRRLWGKLTGLNRLVGWSLFWGLGWFLIAENVYLRMDPSDDLAFAASQSELAQKLPEQATGGWRDMSHLMSIESVRAVLADNLDLFPVSEIPRLARHIMVLCQRYRMDPAFVLSLIQVESSFKIRAVSSQGALGLMQLMPKTAEIVADRFGIRYHGPRALMDPFTNLSIGIAYLSVLRDRYRGYSQYFHIAAYNLGPSRLDELLSQKTFKPVNTKIYYDKIRRGVVKLRSYKTPSDKKKDIRL